MASDEKWRGLEKSPSSSQALDLCSSSSSSSFFFFATPRYRRFAASSLADLVE